MRRHLPVFSPRKAARDACAAEGPGNHAGSPWAGQAGRDRHLQRAIREACLSADTQMGCYPPFPVRWGPALPIRLPVSPSPGRKEAVTYGSRPAGPGEGRLRRGSPASRRLLASISPASAAWAVPQLWALGYEHSWGREGTGALKGPFPEKEGKVSTGYLQVETPKRELPSFGLQKATLQRGHRAGRGWDLAARGRAHRRGRADADHQCPTPRSSSLGKRNSNRLP